MEDLKPGLEFQQLRWAPFVGQDLHKVEEALADLSDLANM